MRLSVLLAVSLDKKLKKEYRPIKRANPDAPGELHAFFEKALDAVVPTPIRG